MPITHPTRYPPADERSLGRRLDRIAERAAALGKGRVAPPERHLPRADEPNLANGGLMVGRWSRGASNANSPYKRHWAIRQISMSDSPIVAARVDNRILWPDDSSLPAGQGYDRFNYGLALGGNYCVGDGGEIEIILVGEGDDGLPDESVEYGRAAATFSPMQKLDEARALDPSWEASYELILPRVELAEPVSIPQGTPFYVLKMNRNPLTSVPGFAVGSPISPEDAKAVSLAIGDGGFSCINGPKENWETRFDPPGAHDNDTEFTRWGGPLRQDHYFCYYKQNEDSDPWVRWDGHCRTPYSAFDHADGRVRGGVTDNPVSNSYPSVEGDNLIRHRFTLDETTCQGASRAFDGFWTTYSVDPGATLDTITATLRQGGSVVATATSTITQRAIDEQQRTLDEIAAGRAVGYDRYQEIMRFDWPENVLLPRGTEFTITLSAPAGSAFTSVQPNHLYYAEAISDWPDTFTEISSDGGSTWTIVGGNSGGRMVLLMTDPRYGKQMPRREL